MKTCEFVLPKERSSFSESWGDMKRAVGRGPVVNGPRDFFNMGCGMMTGVFEAVEDDVVLGLLFEF